MTYLPATVILPGYLLLLFQGCWSRSQSSPRTDVKYIGTDHKINISCLIINLEYIECNWTKPPKQQINYNFSSAFSHTQECTEYLQEHGQNVGCRIPLENPDKRFNPFYTKLSVGGNKSICKNYTDLIQRVKLNPPSNLSVNMSGRDGEVCVHWTMNNILQICVNYTVGYQKASGPLKISSPVFSTSHCVSPLSSGVVYTFKVRSSMADRCGASNFWSDWSDTVQWNKDAINTEPPQVFWHVLGSVLGVIILISLSLLLYYSERIKVVFVPAVPDPSKSLQTLFKKYNGNVESWVYISRELKDAFEPDYTESPCVVCEPSPTLETKTKDGPIEQPAS